MTDRRLICFVRGSAAAEVERVVTLARALPSVSLVCVALAPDTLTADALDAAAARAPNLHVRTLDEDFGSGGAYRAGFAGATEASVGFLNLDGDVAPASIAAFFERLERDAAVDVVVGNRWLSPATNAVLGRRLISRTFSAFASSLFGLHVRDVQAPLKVMRRTVLERVFPGLRLTNLGFDAELLTAIRSRRFTIIEEPLRWSTSGYAFPVASTGLGVGLALLWLRALRSPLSRLPFVDLLGRRFVIPVKGSYDIMLFCWRDPRNPLAGGGEVYLHEQAKSWVAKGHRVTWYAQRFRGAPSYELLDGIQVHRGGGFPWVFPMGALWYVFRKAKAFDFIIDCMNGIPFFTPLFSTKPKVCLVYHVHSHHFREELPWPISELAVAVETKLVPFLYRNTRFLTISESSRLEMERLHMSRRPIEIIESGVPAELVPGPKAANPTILYLGRLKAYKRVRDLIDAFIEIRASIPSARLVIAGEGDDRAPLQSYAAEHGDAGIVFLGRVDDATKMRLMQEAWVLGMPSSIEGWGIVVIEANACGTPAVAYDVAGLRDCVLPGRTGLLAQDAAEFAEALRTILSDDELRAHLSREAHLWAANFSWDRTADITLQQIRRSQPWRAVFEPDEVGGWRLRSNR